MQLDNYDLHTLRKLYRKSNRAVDHKQILSASLSQDTLRAFQKFVCGGMKTSAWGVQSSFTELAILLFLASQDCIPAERVAEDFQSTLSRADCQKVANNLHIIAEYITDNA